MARWRLKYDTRHYIKVPGTVFEYKETSRETGKQARKDFPVPLYINTEDPADQNYPGEVIVAYAGPGAHRKDIIFEGDPNPDMEPLDAEAEAITEAMRAHWGKLGMGDEAYAGQLLLELGDIMTGVAATARPSSPLPAQRDPEVESLKMQVAELTAIMKGNLNGEASGVQSSPVEHSPSGRRR